MTRSARETAEWIWSEYNWWQKPWREHRSLNVFDTSQDRPKKGMMLKPGVVARVAKQADVIGWDRALALSDRFESVLEMVNAGPEEYVQKGVIGEKLAQQVYDEWRRKRVIRNRKNR